MPDSCHLVTFWLLQWSHELCCVSVCNVAVKGGRHWLCPHCCLASCLLACSSRQHLQRCKSQEAWCCVQCEYTSQATFQKRPSGVALQLAVSILQCHKMHRALGLLLGTEAPVFDTQLCRLSFSVPVFLSFLSLNPPASHSHTLHLRPVIFRLHMLKSPSCCLMQEARQKVKEAQAQIAICKREFQAAVQAGDLKKQQVYTSWISHWHRKLAEEKQRAQNRIFSTK